MSKTTNPSPKNKKEPNRFNMDSTKKDFLTEMVNKSHHAGRVYRLPSASKMKIPMTKSQLKAWTSAFLALFNEDEQVNVKHTMFLWRYDDDMSTDAVRNGIPANSKDVKWLFDNSRLLKQDFSPELTDKELQIINEAETLDFPENHANDNEPTVPCKSCNKLHLGTCQHKIDVYDKVTQKITGNQFLSAQKLFEGGPEFPTKTRQNLTRMRKTVEGFKSHMSNYINLDLLPQFEDGQYHTWQILMNAIFRVYKIEESQENMSQLFKNIEDIVSANDKSTETKVGNLREILRRIQIKGKENYFISKDHDLGREVQVVDEHYTPQVNTLITYILFKESIDKKKWDEVQLAFERKIESGWSYQKWHQTRPELYKLMDSMQKSKPLGGAVCSVNTEDTQPEEQDENSVASKVEQLQLELNQLRRGQWQNSNRFKPSYNQGNRKEANGFQRNNWKSNSSGGQQNASSKSALCIHCTHHSGTLVYHANAQYSGGDACSYDRAGNKRGNSGFGNRVAMVESAHDQPETLASDDLRRYYQERLAALEDIPADE